MIKKNCFICEHQSTKNFVCELGLDTDAEFEKSEHSICCTPDFDKVLHLDADMQEIHGKDNKKDYFKYEYLNSKT